MIHGGKLRLNVVPNSRPDYDARDNGAHIIPPSFIFDKLKLLFNIHVHL